MERWQSLHDRGRVLAAEARCRTVGGTPPDLRWLSAATTWLAGAASGWEALVGTPPEVRSYRSIVASPDVEAWLIAWPTGGRLTLHDHGGASGCLQVVDGGLIERCATAGPLRPDGTRSLRTPVVTRHLGPGCPVAFGHDYVHDVVNADARVATSVHVYTAPTARMGFWDRSGRRLVPAALEDDAAVAGERQWA